MIRAVTVGRFLRAQVRRLITHVVRPYSVPTAAGSPLESSAVRRILICRPNAKLGNTLLLLPLVAELHRRFPSAGIDLVSGYPRAEHLLQGVPGIERVVHLSHKPAAAPFTYARALLKMRRRSYDLAIDPTPQSISGRVTLLCSKSRYRLGFSGANMGLHLTHTCPAPASVVHESLRPLMLLEAVLSRDADMMQAPPMTLPITDAERAAGRTCIGAALVRNCGRRYRIGYFVAAAPGKSLSENWWSDFWRQFLALEPEAARLEFLSSTSHDDVNRTHDSVSVFCPRQMAAAIAELDLFISVDTGPMHLASATRVPTIGLFLNTDYKRYGPRKDSDLSLRALEIDPAQAAQRCVQHLRLVCRGSCAVANRSELTNA